MEHYEGFENGVEIMKNDEGFFVIIGGESMQVSEDFYEMIRKYPDKAFELVISAKRKFDFNTAMDRYSPTEY